ncbi:MAG: menaquinone biosynthesis protein [Thermoanaerobacteraceae bacterium]|nr:menaquinone biosynthesis protein [Thermoanaerobacteraceae bacterium]
MKKIRLGKVDYLNCLPVYYGIENGVVPLDVDLYPGPPTALNKKFLAGELDITPISSIEYARNADRCLILPDMSISADGRVTSILLFCKQPVETLEGKKVALTTSSATSVAMLKILMKKFWQLNVKYLPMKPVLDAMLQEAEAALLIGDDALRANAREHGYLVYDLGEVWKQYTGLPMVYALWVIRSSFAQNDAQVERIARAFLASKHWGMENLDTLIDAAQASHQLDREIISDHFAHIKHQFDSYYQEALLRYYQEAYELDLIPQVPTLKIRGETNEG